MFLAKQNKNQIQYYLLFFMSLVCRETLCQLRELVIELAAADNVCERQLSLEPAKCLVVWK